MPARRLFLLAALPACTGGPIPDDKDDAPAEDCPRVVVTPDALEWQGLTLGDPATGTVSVVNNCARGSALSVVPSQAGSAAFVTEAAPASIERGGVATFDVTVTPTGYAGEEGTLTFTTNDPDAPIVTVALTAIVNADLDADGFDTVDAGGTDCDDLDAAIQPGATEAWYDSVDQDCSGTSDYDQDGDGLDGDAWGGTDCDDLDAAIHPGATEVLNGLDDDCDGVVEESYASPGDLVITEVMPNPAAVSDTLGEWIEVYNATAFDIDLDGWSVYADDGQTFTVSGATGVPAGGYAVLGVSSDTAVNGGVGVDYAYAWSGFGLSDAGDSIYLYSGSTLVAELSWTSAWPFASGFAMQIDPDHANVTDATEVSYWCAGAQVYGSGDRGTPGSANDACSSVDHDGDGESEDDGDCDDTDATVYSEATEVLDGLDQDCDGLVDNVVVSLSGLPVIWGDGASANAYAYGYGDTDGDGALEVGMYQTYTTYTEGMYVLDGAGFRSWNGVAADHDVAYLDPGTPTSAGYRTSRRWTDHTGDGLADVVMSYDDAGGGYDQWYVFSAPTGTLDAADAALVCTGTRSPDVAGRMWTETDFNGDGLAEVIYADNRYGGTYSAGGRVTVHDIAGLSGTIASADAMITVDAVASTVQLGIYTQSGDVDADGYPDLVVGTSLYDTSYVILGDGLAAPVSGTYSGLAALTIPSAVNASGDYDGDGELDILGSDGRVYTNLGGRSGTLSTSDATTRLSPRASGSACYPSVLRVDLDADGNDDLNFYCQYSYPLGNLTYLFGADVLSLASADEDDAFASLSFTENTGALLLRDLVDLDGDGDEEFVVHESGSSALGLTYIYAP